MGGNAKKMLGFGVCVCGSIMLQRLLASYSRDGRFGSAQTSCCCRHIETAMLATRYPVYSTSRRGAVVVKKIQCNSHVKASSLSVVFRQRLAAPFGATFVLDAVTLQPQRVCRAVRSHVAIHNRVSTKKMQAAYVMDVVLLCHVFDLD